MLLPIACPLPYVLTLACRVRREEHIRDSTGALQQHHRKLKITHLKISATRFLTFCDAPLYKHETHHNLLAIVKNGNPMGHVGNPAETRNLPAEGRFLRARVV